MFSESTNTPPRIGLELEVAFKNVYDGTSLGRSLLQNGSLADFWIATEDGSIGEGGCEFVMKHPHALDDYALMYIHSLMTTLQATPGFWVNSACGTHIHVDCMNATKRQIAIFIVLCMVVQDLMFQLCDKRRRFSNFAVKLVPSRQLAQTVVSMLYGIKSESVSEIYKYRPYIENNQFKYSGINLWSLTKNERGSIEFRMFPGVTTYDELVFWTQLVAAVRSSVNRINGLGALSVKLQTHTPLQFLQFIVGEELLTQIKQRIKIRTLNTVAQSGFHDGLILCNLMNQLIHGK